MNSYPDDVEISPEPPLSELCMNLEDKFVSMQDSSKGESMNVYARIRPMLESEIEAGYKECIGLIDEKVVRAVAPASSSKFKMSSHLCQDIIEDFTFTAAYGPETGQFVFFNESMMDTIKNFIEGLNSLVFSYGTTGSGKTFTLQGNTDNPGIIPLSLHLFFASIEDQLLDKVFFKPDKFSGVIALNENEIKKELEIKERLLSACNQEEWNFKDSSSKSLGMLLCETFSDHFEGDGLQTTLGPEEMAQAQAAALMKEISKKSAENQSGYCSVWVSFVEIYNENIYDLLQPNLNQRAKLNLGEDKNGDVYVKGLQEVCVSNTYEALSLLSFGQRNLRIASTKLNYQSSRSHCIFTVKVVRIPDPENMSYAKVNRLSFCDLAGSERAAKSQTTGMRLKEAGCINTSLLVLGRCLEQLRLNPSQRDKKLIPFRESKLTRLFSGFFTGRGKSVMITNASPSELTFDETLHVLRFSAIAKELIINDSYIKTAASTLQSIANMWTDVKTNCKNQSLSSTKSISFDDSMDDALQEKDELIEKLLDLAESLKSNLEREKKEKAELETKIRQDVCVEYSEFRDELLAMQKQAFDEEKEAVKEIYEKRISAMEKRYEKIISDFKIQLEESLTSDDETSFRDAFGTPSSVNPVKQFEICANASENEAPVNTDASPKSNNISNIARDSSKTEEELQKTVDYSLSLEVELEHLRRKYEDVQLMLENTVKENDEIKKELDAHKIDVLAFRTNNDTLLKDKLDLEADLKAFREDLVTVTQEKEALFQELTDSKEKLSCLTDQISNLLKSINELTRVKEEIVTKYEKTLEEAHMKNNQLKDQLLAVSEELQAEKKETKYLKSVISTLEEKVSELQSTEQDNLRLKSAIESLSVVNDDLKNANILLKTKLEFAEASKTASHQAESGTKDEIENLKTVHQEEINKLSDSLEKHKADANEAKEILKSVNKILENSQEVIEKQKKEITSIGEECTLLKEELSKVQSMKKDMEVKLQSLTESLELEKQKASEFANELDKVKEKAAKFDSLERDYLACKNEMATLEKANLDLEEKLMLASKKSECEMSFKEQLESKCRKLKEAVSTIDSQKDEMEKLRCENRKYSDELVEFKNAKKNLENEFGTISSQIESEMKLKEQLESECKRLEEAVNTVNLQKDEIEKLRCENRKCNDELAELKKLNCDLQNKLDAIISQNDNVHELVKVLETCEIKATHNIEEIQSNLEQLKEKLATSSVNHEKEYTVLHQLINILEKCEAFASDKIKQFHSTSIKYVEQIMDLESTLKTKEKVIDVLNNDINDLQKNYKDLQTSSKKQQAEIQKIKSESEKMEMRLTDYKKLNESLKCGLAKLEAEKDKLENEYKNLKDKEEAAKRADEEENRLKNKTPERRTSKKRKEETISDEKSPEIRVLKEVKNQEDKRRNKKTTEQSEKNTENKKPETEISENQDDKRRNRKSSEKSKVITENKKPEIEISEIREDKRRNRKAIEKKEIATKNKKQKTEIYEEADDNSSSENVRQEKKAGRRQLKCMSNVTDERESIQRKDEISSKNKTSKRKADASEYKSPEKKNLKKLKMHSVNNAENAHKPQNLRVLLLKSSVNVNDIPLPSPRMTRGRKRLVLAKELTSSPRTVRS